MNHPHLKRKIGPETISDTSARLWMICDTSARLSMMSDALARHATKISTDFNPRFTERLIIV